MLQLDQRPIEVSADGRCFWASLYLHFAGEGERREWAAVVRNKCGFPHCSKRLQEEGPNPLRSRVMWPGVPTLIALRGKECCICSCLLFIFLPAFLVFLL